jgi:hypothetical protein
MPRHGKRVFWQGEEIFAIDGAQMKTDTREIAFDLSVPICAPSVAKILLFQLARSTSFVTPHNLEWTP